MERFYHLWMWYEKVLQCVSDKVASSCEGSPFSIRGKSLLRGKTDSTYSCHLDYIHSLLIPLLILLTPIELENAGSSFQTDGPSIYARPIQSAHLVLYRPSLGRIRKLLKICASPCNVDSLLGEAQSVHCLS